MFKQAILNLVAAGVLLTACNKNAGKRGQNGPPIQITSTTTLSVHGGDTVTVYGKNLPTDLSSYTVTLNGHAFTLIGGSADSIRGVVPKMAGSGHLVVNAYQDTVQGPPMTYNYVVTVSTIAGSGSVGAVNGDALFASFNCPWGITADANGDLYIADCYNRLLRKYTAATTTISQTNIPNISFYSPYNIALDRVSHNLYVTDFNAHVLKVSPDNSFSVIDTNTRTSTGIAVGPDRWLYLSDNILGTVTRLDSNGKNGTIIGQNITTPRNLIFDKAGNLYVAAYGIFQLTPTWVQSQLFVDPQFKGWEIARDTLGNIYEADHFNNNLRMYEASTRTIFTIAGSGVAGDIDGIGLDAGFNGPQGLCIDDNGVLFMTTFNYDSNGGNKIRKITIQ
ncbi:MAG TPA: IPT/TIG domain-containing protein [Puia sp.]|jgi:streptogramin lyase